MTSVCPDTVLLATKKQAPKVFVRSIQIATKLSALGGMLFKIEDYDASNNEQIFDNTGRA